MKGPKIKHIFNSIKEAHIVVNRGSGAVEMTNPATKAIYGLSEKVITQSPDARFQCIHESERARVRALYERLVRHGTAYTIQYRVIRPNGTVKWVEEHSRVVKSDGEEQILTTVVSSGIALHRSEERQLKALNEIGHRLLNAQSLDAAAPGVLQAICTGLDWDCGSIWLADEDCLSISLAHQWYLHDTAMRQSPEEREYYLAQDPKSAFDSALMAGNHIWISEIDSSDLPLTIKSYGASGFRTCVSVPISSLQVKYGSLLLFSNEPREQQNELLQTLKLIATQIGRLIHCTSHRSDQSQIRPTHASSRISSDAAVIFVSLQDGTILRANRQAELLFASKSHTLQTRQLRDILEVEESADIDLPKAMRLVEDAKRCTFLANVSIAAEESVTAMIDLRRVETYDSYVAAVTITPTAESRSAAPEGAKSLEDFVFLEHLPTAIALLDGKLNFAFASARWLDDFELNSNSVVGKAYSEVFRESLSRWESIFTRALAGESTICDEDEFTISSGAKEWVNWSVSPWKSSTGEICGVILCTRLVSRERRSRESLRRAESKYRALFDNMLDGIAYHRIITDDSGDPVDYVFLEVNQAFEEMTGLKRSEIVGRRVTEILPEIQNDERDWIGTYGQVALNGGQIRFEDYSRDLDKWYSVAAYCPKEGYFVVVTEDITKRKSAQAELIEAGRTISTLLGNLPGMAYRCLNDPSWKMEYVSDGVLELTGYEAEELVAGASVSYKDIVAPQDRDYVWEEVQSALRQDRPFRISYRIRSRDGETKWVWEQGCAIKDENGEVVALEGFITDVTERKRAEDALRSREEFYHELIDNSSDLFSIIDVNCNLIYQSTSVERSLGYAPEDMIQTNGFSYVHPDDVNEVKRQLLRVLTEKAEPTVTYRFRAANGNWRMLESKARNLLDNPHVRGIVVNSRDITERSRVELELMKLATAVDQAAEAIVITDTEGNIQYVNPAFEQMSGYERVGVIGRNPRFLRSGENLPATYQEMWENISTGRHWVGRLVNRRRDGKEYHVESAISPMKNDEGEIINYVAVQRDISKEKELEDQLRQAQKLEAVGRLASGIAHDFNNLLAGIRGFGELISLDTSTDPKIKSFAEEIIAAAGRAADLTGQLLAFSRQGNYLSVPVNVHTIIEEVAAILRHTMEKNIRLETELTAESCSIKGDPSQIQSAILNLAVNAADAMADGGALTIRTRNREVDAEYRDHHDLVTDQSKFVAIEVADTGVGIPTDQLSHIFDPFFTTKPQGEGTGLGLAGVYGCAKNHKGGVFVQSNPGVGSTFTVLLPLIDDSSHDPRDDADSDVSMLTCEIVVVDDQEDTLKAAERILSKAGYNVTTCSSGDQFLQLVREDARVDLALLDVVMPGLSGQEVFLLSRELRPNLRVVLMSAYSDGQLHKSLDAGLTGFLPKPFDAKSLLDKVREALGSASPMRQTSRQPSQA